MASSFACRACRRALQQQVASLTQSARNRTSPSLRASFSVSSRPAQQQSQQSVRQEASSSPAALENNDDLSAQRKQRTTPGNAYASAAAGAPSHAAMSRAIAQSLHKRASGSTETYLAYGGTEVLFRECARQADYKVVKNEEGEAPKTEKGEDLGVGEGWWYEGLGLTPTFNTWAQITFLHMYALTTRIRQFPKEFAPAWHQHLIDHFFYEAENRMVIYHNMQARGIRNKYLHDLFIQWRGVMAAYDEGLVKGDAVLATALWRNIWKAEEINPVGLATVVSYLRREVKRLEEISDEAFTAGQIQFEGPEKEEVVVHEQSPQLERPFTAEELAPKEKTKS